MTDTLLISRDGPVARVFLNRPDVRNAFNDGVIAELTAAFTGFAADATLRAVVLGGHGKAFCAGADLSWMRAMADYTWEQNRADAQGLADMLYAIWSCPVPVIGRVHGDCYAGGVGLAAVCDILVAAEGVNFCLSEARLGLLPATIGPYVVKALGEQASRRYFTTAERFDAARAHALGFVHEVVPADALDAKVDELVAALVANGPAAVRACKKLVQDVAGRADRRRAARRYGTPYRRHPRQRRRQGGRAGLPQQAGSVMALNIVFAMRRRPAAWVALALLALAAGVAERGRDPGHQPARTGDLPRQARPRRRQARDDAVPAARRRAVSAGDHQPRQVARRSAPAAAPALPCWRRANS